MIVKLELVFIYLVLGVALSFSTGVTIGGLIGSIISLFKLLKYKTAWFSMVTFLFITVLAANFAIAVLPLVGKLGDQTEYEMQNAFLITAIIPGLLTWIPSIYIGASVSVETIKTNSYRTYGFIWGLVVVWTCGLIGALIVFKYLMLHLSLGWLCASLVFYPITFVVAPFYMAFSDGIWLPILLHFGGLVVGGIIFNLPSDD